MTSMRRVLLPLCLAFVVVACGARTPLLERNEAGEGSDSGAELDAPIDTGSVDTALPDVVVIDDVSEEPGSCEDQQNTSFAPADCGGPSDEWFAWPWTPARDMEVQRIEIHTTGGSVALLTDHQSLPGTLLFQGSVGMSGSAVWLGADVSPSVHVTGGQPYWLAEQASYCSQALGGTQFIEYWGPSLNGPWQTTGTGSYTTHVFGVCP